MNQKEKDLISVQDDVDTYEAVDLDEGNPSSCMACGGRLKSASLLICRDCLGDECEQFLSLVESNL